MSVLRVVHGSTHKGGRVNAGMPAEAPVLELDQRFCKALRNGVAGRETPLPVGRDPGAQKLPLGTFHYGGVGRGGKQLPGQAEQPRCK